MPPTFGSPGNTHNIGAAASILHLLGISVDSWQSTRPLKPVAPNSRTLPRVCVFFSHTTRRLFLPEIAWQVQSYIAHGTDADRFHSCLLLGASRRYVQYHRITFHVSAACFSFSSGLSQTPQQHSRSFVHRREASSACDESETPPISTYAHVASIPTRFAAHLRVPWRRHFN